MLSFSLPLYPLQSRTLAPISLTRTHLPALAPFLFPGNKEVKHRNPNIKYDFEVVKGQKVYQLNARTMTEANNWIDTIQYVIDQCEKAAEGGPVPDGEFMPRKRDPEEEAAARDAAVRHHAYGTGLFEGVRGEQSEFTIQAYDEYDNPKTYGGDEFKITIENEELHFDVRAIDNNDGTYSVAYTPTQTYDPRYTNT